MKNHWIKSGVHGVHAAELSHEIRDCFTKLCPEGVNPSDAREKIIEFVRLQIAIVQSGRFESREMEKALEAFDKENFPSV